MKLPPELTTVTPLSKTVAFVLFITLPMLGFLLGKTLPLQTPQNKQWLPATNNTVPVEPSVPMQKEDADWNTYTNTDLRFSFRYPPHWDLQSCFQENGNQEPGTTPCQENTYYKDENNLKHLKLISPETTEKMEIFITKELSLPVNPTPTMPAYPGASSNIVELPALTVGGVFSRQISAAGSGSQTITTVTENNDMVFTFWWDEQYWDEESKQQADQLYRKILDSFRFL